MPTLEQNTIIRLLAFVLLCVGLRPSFLLADGDGKNDPPSATPRKLENICGSPGAFVPGFAPDLKKIENRINLAILVKF